MAIQTKKIGVGGIYATAGNQERRVVKIEGGQVHYESRGGKVKNKWAPGHPKAKAPTLAAFAKACEKVIEKPLDTMELFWLLLQSVGINDMTFRQSGELFVALQSLCPTTFEKALLGNAKKLMQAKSGPRAA